MDNLGPLRAKLADNCGCGMNRSPEIRTPGAYDRRNIARADSFLRDKILTLAASMPCATKKRAYAQRAVLSTAPIRTWCRDLDLDLGFARRSRIHISIRPLRSQTQHSYTFGVNSSSSIPVPKKGFPSLSQLNKTSPPTPSSHFSAWLRGLSVGHFQPSRVAITYL